jgi:ligand-binding sensor domain-containing protein
MFCTLKILPFYLFLLSIWTWAGAQQYGYVQYNLETGAPFDKALTVLKDPVGFVWIGSSKGLYRFDGIQFDNFSKHTQSQFIHQLRARADELLFVNDLGLYRIEDLRARRQVELVLEGAINETDDLPFYPNGFEVGAGTDIWLAQSNHSIGRIQEGQFTTYRFSKAQASQQLAIQKDSSGGIWVLSAMDGLFRYDSARDSFDKSYR